MLKQNLPDQMVKPGKVFLKTLAGESSTPPPLWMMRQAGRYLPEYREIRSGVPTFLDMCFTPEFAVEVTLQPIRRFGFNAAILFSDILVIPHALGQNVTFVAGEGPKLDPLEKVPEFQADQLHDVLSPVYQTVETLARELPEETALIGFAGAPWTVAAYMIEGGGSRDFETVRRYAYENEHEFQTLIDVLVKSTTEYLTKQIDYGVETLQIFDSWAGLLPEDQFQKWVVEPTKQIVSNLRSTHPDIPIIGFPRMAGPLYTKYVAKTGVDAVSLDQTVPLEWAKQNLQNKNIVVQGNLDPMVLLAGGAPLETAVQNIKTTLGGAPFIFNLGHGIHKDTPVEHVETLVNLVRGG